VISLELSKIVPRDGYYFAGVIPGLFFELVVALANPGLVAEMVYRLQVNPHVGKYSELAITLFLALIIGHAFMLLVLLIQYLLGLIFRTCRRIAFGFEKHVLLRLLNWWFKPGAKPKKHALWLIRVNQSIRSRIFFPEATPGFLWWWAMAKRLLLVRYGLKEEELPSISRDAAPLQMVLTTPTVNEVRGSLFMIAVHATGWSAFTASLFAPMLRDFGWYFVFCAFLVGNGLLHDCFLAWRNNSHRLGDILRLRSVLREFPPISRADSSSEAPEK
jgi:hypothetical protein